jgi:hypothetical protein
VSLIDKLTGRTKKAAGDLAGDESLRRAGRQEERKGEAKDELARPQPGVLLCQVRTRGLSSPRMRG